MGKQVVIGMLRFVLSLVLPLALSLDNGFNRPAMGFNPWNCFGVGRTGTFKLHVPWAHGFNDTVIRSVADAMVSNGLANAGYKYVNLDCGWTTGFRDKETGRQIVNSTRYPNGIKPLADYVHARGLKFGIYSSASTSQCCSKFYKDANDGSLDHEEKDAATYAEYGVDYLKFDGCGQEQRSYLAMRDALNKTGRSIVLSVNGFNMSNVEHAGDFANSWRTTPDDDVSFLDSLAPRIFQNDKYAQWAGPGKFNDPDMLEVGNIISGGFGSVTDARSHFSLWCIAKAPLIIGTDVTNITSEALDILTNTEAIEVNQDPLGIQARVVWRSARQLKPKSQHGLAPVPLQSIWAGPLERGRFAVILFNAAEKSTSIKLTAEMIQQVRLSTMSQDQPNATFYVRDLWAHKDIGSFSSEYEANVKPHEAI